jgi:hypothetical protein
MPISAYHRADAETVKILHTSSPLSLGPAVCNHCLPAVGKQLVLRRRIMKPTYFTYVRDTNFMLRNDVTSLHITGVATQALKEFIPGLDNPASICLGHPDKDAGLP